MTSPNTSGTQQLPNEIQNTQTQSNNYDASHVICNSDGTIDVKGQVIFNPPLPVVDSSKIFSPDLSSQLQCINGGQITVLGEIQGYSTTSQTNQNLNNAIGDLSTVYMPIDQTLNNIPLADGTVDLNQQQIDNLADPTDLQNAVNLQYLQNNYTDTTLSQQYVNEEISLLSTVYMPIDQTLNNIPQATGNINVNNNKITNLTPGTDQSDAVCLSQLDGYIPITGNINDLTAQTADYSTQGFQITNSSLPTQGDDLTNKTYVDNSIAALSTVYYPQTDTLSDIAVPTQTMDFNGQVLSNIGINSNATDAVRQDYLQTYYLTTGDAANIYQTIANMVNYVTSSYLTSNYYTNTYIDSTFATIASLANYVTNSSLATQLSNYVTQTYLDTYYYTSAYIDSTFATLNDISGFVQQSYLDANYYTKTWIDGNFQTIAGMANYVSNSSLATTLSGYVTQLNLDTQLSAYVTSTYLSANYYTQSYIDSTFATIASLSNYVTNSSLATTLSSYVTNSSLASTLSSYVTSAYLTSQNYLKTADISLYTTEIKTNSTVKSKVSCASASEILFNINDVQKLRMYVPSGQATNPCGLIADDKIQMISKENSFSLTGQKALQAKPTQNYSGLYISGLDDATLNVGQQIQIGSQYCQKLAIASGHTDIGGGTQVLYSSISNSAEGIAQQNLQISGGTPQTDNTIVLYSNSYATTLGQNLTAQFTGKTGYSTTTTISENNQFTSKTYVDSAISALSSVYLTISNAASTYLTIANAASTYQTISGMGSYLTTSAASTLYYTQSYIDATFATIASLSNYVTNSSLATTLSSYVTNSSLASTLSSYVLQTTPLNDLTAPTGNLSMNNQKITGLQLCTNANDAANKAYVDANTGGSFTQAIADTLYYSFANTNLPTQSLNMNSQNIINVLNPTTAQMAATKNYVDTRTPFKSAIVVVGNLTSATAPSSVTSVSGFVISATKQATVNNSASSLITINYSNLGFTPMILVTVQAPLTSQSAQYNNGLYGYVTSASTTQATIVIGAPTVSLFSNIQPVVWTLNILALSNTLT